MQSTKQPMRDRDLTRILTGNTKTSVTHAHRYKSTPDLPSQRDNLLRFKTIMDQHQLSFFLVFGTCLGIVRDGDIIPHDQDADVAIYFEDAPRFYTAISDLKKEGFELVDICKWGAKFSIKRNDDYIDIYLIYKVKNPFYRLLGYRWKVSHGLFKADYYDHDVETEHRYLGQEFRIPNQVIAYLEEHYGKSWKIPIKDVHAEYTPLLSRLLYRLNPFIKRSKDMPSKFTNFK
jgi:hypothetical protein